MITVGSLVTKLLSGGCGCRFLIEISLKNLIAYKIH